MSTITSILSLVTNHWAISGGVGTLLMSLIPFAGNILSAGSLTYIKMGIYGAIALALVGGGFYAGYEIENGKLQAAEAQIANATAKADAKAFAEEKAYEAKADKAVSDAQAYASKMQQTETVVRRTIYATPKSYACSRSPAVRALLNSLRSYGDN